VGALPKKLAGVSVRVGGKLARIDTVAAHQIRFIAPALPAGEAMIEVITGPARRVAGKVSVPVQDATPEFLFGYPASGPNFLVMASDTLTGRKVGPAERNPDARPAYPGELVSVIGLGFGGTDPEIEPGTIPMRQARTRIQPVVYLGGTRVADEDVIYSGVMPEQAGLYLLTIRIPADTPDGMQPLVIQLGEYSSSNHAHLLVQR
jgi:uncharacterized protein (TIGR03437 family)